MSEKTENAESAGTTGATSGQDAHPMSEAKRTALAVLMLLGIFVVLVFPFLGGVGPVEIAVWCAVLIGTVWLAWYLRATRRREGPLP